MNALSDNSIVGAAFFAGKELYLVSAIACPDFFVKLCPCEGGAFPKGGPK